MYNTIIISDSKQVHLEDTTFSLANFLASGKVRTVVFNRNYASHQLIKDLQQCIFAGIHAVVNIGGHTACPIDNWDDLQIIQGVLNDSLSQLEYSKLSDDIALFIKQQGLSEDDLLYINSDLLISECQAYNIELSQTLLPVEKHSVRRITDPRLLAKLGMTKDMAFTSNDEKYSYKYVITLLDRIKAYLTLTYYKQAGIEPFVSTGITELPVQEVIVVPVSACGLGVQNLLN